MDTTLARRARPKAMKGAAEAVGQHAVNVEVDVVTGGCFTFQLLTGARDRGAASCQLTLTFGDKLAAEVTDDLD
jgi:hypothetical protein